MQEFYLRSKHGNCGTNLMFHNKGGAGYGTDLDNLRIYSSEEAQKEIGYGSLPLLKSEVDALSITALDHQYIKHEDDVIDDNDKYVVQKKDLWNGNDIAFVVMGGTTFNYSDAHIFTSAGALFNDQHHVWSKSYLNKLCRRTFQEENINIRTMITGPGLEYKKPRKKRPTTGKIRWNCPRCGKINWQYHPHDFEGCTDLTCVAHYVPHFNRL